MGLAVRKGTYNTLLLKNGTYCEKRDIRYIAADVMGKFKSAS